MRVPNAQNPRLLRLARADDGQGGVENFAVRGEMHGHERAFGIAGRQAVDDGGAIIHLLDQPRAR